MPNYYEVEPSEILKKFIQCYWVMDGTCLSEDLVIKVLPDGCFDIVIDVQFNKKNEIVL